MSARKKAPVNLLMCPFEVYMFIGVSMQLRAVFKIRCVFLAHNYGHPCKKRNGRELDLEISEGGFKVTTRVKVDC